MKKNTSKINLIKKTNVLPTSLFSNLKKKKINNTQIKENNSDNIFSDISLNFSNNFSNNVNNTLIDVYNKNQLQLYTEIPNTYNTNIHENDIQKLLPRGKILLSKSINIDVIETCILIIDFDNLGGGTSFFIESIISKYKEHQTFLIARNSNNKIIFTVNDDYNIEGNNLTNENAFQLLLNNKNKIEKIFVNHILNHSSDFINNLFNLNIEVTTITHDLLLLFNKFDVYFNDIDTFINDKSKKQVIDINKFNKIITQNPANLNIYNPYIQDKTKIIITPLPDFKKSNYLINNNNSNNTIVIGIIGLISENKGKTFLREIINFYKNKKKYIKIITFGLNYIENNNKQYPYKSIEELNRLLVTHKPNVLLELSIWPETYSYTLTLGMITQLPILFLKKNNNSVVEQRLSTYQKAFSFTNMTELNYLIYIKKQNYFYTIEPVIYFNDFWDNYFITKKEKKINQITNNILPYVIYFPQFHNIKENNLSFYPDYSDIKNLMLIQQNNNIQINMESPSLKELQIQNLNEYDYVKNKNILQRQINIINDYNIAGFAIYYYWFSSNTITGENLIMKNVINQFFDNSHDMKNKKCYFIWANESWSNNPAFGKTTEIIKTEYTTANLNNISNNLLSYFKNENYLKIDNKPVFEIHHPWFMTIEEIDTFYNIINDICVKNNFNGIHFIVNSINNNYTNYINRAHHFNYKNSTFTYYDDKLKQIFLDYPKYTDNIQNDTNDIHTIVFNFDNRIRLFKPNKLDKSTICKNNTEIDKIMFIKKILEKYKKQNTNDIQNLLLINSWNEWGEKMAIEPSEEYGYYYLNLLNQVLSNF